MTHSTWTAVEAVAAVAALVIPGFAAQWRSQRKNNDDTRAIRAGLEGVHDAKHGIDAPGLFDQVHELRAEVAALKAAPAERKEQFERLEGLLNLVLSTQQQRTVEDGKWRGRIETRLDGVEARVSTLERPPVERRR